ncbi:MAG: small basic family protein [Bacillota bacterium]|nr:small basic family protein [Bacillota bacterium]
MNGAVWLLIGLLAGLVAGFRLPVALPLAMARYHSVALLAALDSVFGGWRARLVGGFDPAVFLTGFFGNAVLAAALTYIGDRTGVELYLAAVFALGTRIFMNLGAIRRLMLGMTGSNGQPQPPRSEETP